MTLTVSVPRPDETPALGALTAALAERYRIERELGRGGMATVYLARDLRHERPVALKVLHPELAQQLGPERFRREIRTAAGLQHPHILSVHDSGDTAGQLWFTMPYVAGESLRERLRRERQLPIAQAVRLTREVALALEHAHRHGVVHRDVKPENILLAEDGQALLADFGIARALATGGGEPEQGVTALTATGLSIGTPAYMSPEQVAGDRGLDGRSDTYSLGCVLYEMLAGEAPFTGRNVQAVLARRLSGEVPRVRVVRPAVSEALESVLRSALAPVAADRVATAADFARALEGALETRAPAEGRPTVAPVSFPPAGRTPASGARRRRLYVGLALLLAVLVSTAAFLAWRGARSTSGLDTAAPSGVTRLAVLPFENLGAPEDEYFADGITDEVRGRLSMLPALQVIARGSSTPYKRSTESPQRIARELGVEYLLTATVRWEKVPGGPSKVNVSPELMEVRSSGAPSIKWRQPFEASLTGVFQLYADVGSRVAQALDVALSDSARRQLAEKPTESLAAYDAYLKGEEAAPTLLFGDPPTLRRAAEHYTQAVALDSTFARAWAQLSLAHSSLYFLSTPTPGQADLALTAAERARDLAPGRGESHLALGFYYLAVTKDNVRAAEEFRQGQLASPSSADLLVGRALAAQRLDFDTALTHLRQAQALDPRSVSTAEQLTLTLLMLRRYAEARQAAERTLVLVPSDLFGLQYLAMTALAQGEVAEARAVVTAALEQVDAGGLLSHFAVYMDLYWLLDESQQQQLLGLPLGAFGDDRVGRGLAFAGTYALRGDRTRARAYADSSRMATEEQLGDTPDDAQLHALHGLSLAYLGRRTEAIEAGQRGVALLPLAKDALIGPYIQHQLVRIYLLVGETEKALDQLEPLLQIPYHLSSGWLRVDPTFDPLRGHPRFERLARGGP